MYPKEILIRNQNLIHKHKLAEATEEFEGVNPFCYAREGENPSCGDDLWFYLRIEGGIITDGSWDGYGCAISQAAADMMLDEVLGLPVDEVQKRAEAAIWEIRNGLFDGFEFANKMNRMRCVLMPWETIQEMLENT